jgi:hypothetical protein
MVALLPLGRLSNEDEDKRQCTAGDEGKTNDACSSIFDLTFGLGAGLDIAS